MPLNLQNEEQIKKFIMEQLPKIMEKDAAFQQTIFRLSSRFFAEKKETESRFDKVLNELRENRERQDKKWAKQDKRWEAQEKKWAAQEKKWEAQDKKWKAQDKKWAAQEKKWAAQEKKWAAQEKKWETQDKKWWENQRRQDEMMASIKALARKHDTSIGALGARWGLHSEQSFRNALRGILEPHFAVKVINVTEFDEEGVVFGHPDQVELDLIVKDGLLIICEIKSSVSKADMYAFHRKAEFYEKQHKKKVDQKIIISPMIQEQAKKIAEKLGIKTYSHAEEIEIHRITNT